MYIDFDELPNQARLWIYQSSRELSHVELEKAEALLLDFTKEWQAHGASLKASFKLSYQRFLIIGVDAGYHQPSGCSIDASVAVVRQLEQAFNISFFERTQIPFRLDQRIDVIPMTQLKTAVADGRITPETITFNNLVTEKAGLSDAWEVPAKDTWLARYF